MDNSERERIADQVIAIPAKHDKHSPAAVEALVEMLRAEGWHLALHVEEEGLRYWSIEEGAHPSVRLGDDRQ